MEILLHKSVGALKRKKNIAEETFYLINLCMLVPEQHGATLTVSITPHHQIEQFLLRCFTFPTLTAKYTVSKTQAILQFLHC